MSSIDDKCVDNDINDMIVDIMHVKQLVNTAGML